MMQTTQVLQHTLQTDLIHARPPAQNRLVQNMITPPLPQHSFLHFAEGFIKGDSDSDFEESESETAETGRKNRRGREHGKREYELSRNIN